MGNVSDDIQRSRASSLAVVLRASVRDGKRIEDLVLPLDVAKCYLYTLLGDEYILHGLNQPDISSRKNNYREAERCYDLALENIEKYARGSFSENGVMRKLDYLKKNLL